MLNISFLFFNFYTNLYVAYKLNNHKFCITKKNTIVIFGASLFYSFFTKFSILNHCKILLTFMVLIIILKSIFNEKLSLTIQTCFFTLLVMIFSEQIIGIIFTDLLNINLLNINLCTINSNKFIVLFFSNLLICCIDILIVNSKNIILKLFKTKPNLILNNSVINNIFITNLTAILLFTYLSYYKYFDCYYNNKIFFSIIIISILYLCIAVIFLYTNYISSKNYDLLKIKEKEYHQLKLYSDTTESLIDDIEQFKHDYNNIIFMMNGYIENKDYTGLKKYFSKEVFTEKDYYDISKLKRIKDSGIKGLLATKISHMIKDNIKASIEILTPIEILYIDMIDLCRILGILLDNAHEAAKNSDEHLVSISFIQDEFLNITILNSHNTTNINIDSIYKKNYSSKGTNRGIGLYNVKEILNNKYPNVILNTYVENHMFIQDIFIKAK